MREETFYRPGELIVDTPRFERGRLIAQLPHSCNEWKIGGVEEIDSLIADLTKAKEAIVEGRIMKGREYDE